MPRLTTFETLSFSNADDAVARLNAIYNANIQYLRDSFESFAKGKAPESHVRAYYPYIQLTTEHATRVDTRLAFGFVSTPGTYRTTVTRPDLYQRYYTEQLQLLMRNHSVQISIGVSRQPIPIHFAFPDGMYIEGGLSPERLTQLRPAFDLPDLAQTDDRIANGTYVSPAGEPFPLALFTAPRVDYSLHRLRHYTGTSPQHFQNYVLFTNYQFYIDEFVRLATEMMAPTDDPALKAQRSQYTSFVQPSNVVLENRNINSKAAPTVKAPSGRLPQMPAYHLVRPDNNGITMINIGIGPSNAKTMTDHVAVLRPHVWVMLGHCAGLRASQRLGDYVLAHGYVRDDHVLDSDLPLWVPVPALAEVQVALQEAVGKTTGLTGYDLKKILRTGTVATVDDRNWELKEQQELIRRFNQSRAIALDMESATIAANGFRFRVPYGTLLCVSDRPLQGDLKLAGMADDFYRRQVDQHLRIGMQAMELLRTNGLEHLHSRKLRSFSEVAFQ